jgi:hypothetical protein
MDDADWRAALDLVVARTGHARYRTLCDDAHPDRGAWRARMVAKAAGMADAPAPAPPSYPPLARQALNLAGAASRAAVAALTGGAVSVPADVLAGRRAACLPCEFNGLRDSGGIRCTRCGCGAKKLEWAQESCPLPQPRWGRWAPPAPAADAEPSP